jgi:hypothetical protein
MSDETKERESQEDAFAQRAIAESMLSSRERREPFEVLPANQLRKQTEALLRHFEDARSRSEEQMFDWPLLGSVREIYQRADILEVPADSVVKDFVAEKTNEAGWYLGIPVEYATQRKWMDIPREAFRATDESGKTTKSWQVIEHKLAVNLGSEAERRAEAEKLTKYAEEVRARLKNADMWHYYIQHIEDIGGLTKFYFLANPITPQDLERDWNASSSPEENTEVLETVGGVVFDKDKALGQMQDSVFSLLELIGYSEKKEWFKWLLSSKGMEHIINSSLDNAEKEQLIEKWFGEPDKWTEIKERKGVETVDQEVQDKKRGLLTERGNLFVRGDESDNIRLIKERIVEFLGGGETARLATELAWRKFRFYGCASTLGLEWIYDEKGKKKKALIDLGADSSDDMGKVIHPDGYQIYYAGKGRGGGPIGSLGRIKPYATDVLRATMIEDYKLPDGSTANSNLPGFDKEFPTSLWELKWKYGIRLGDVNFNRLPDRALIGPYLRMFMAAKGSEFGGGSFDTMTDEKISSPEPFLTPGFWHTLWRNLDVGTTKAVVAFSGGSIEYPSDDGLKNYKLEQVGVFLDGLLSQPLAKKWDSSLEELGEKGILPGFGDKEWGSKTATERIILVANQSIRDLNYRGTRTEIHKKYNVQI